MFTYIWTERAARFIELVLDLGLIDRNLFARDRKGRSWLESREKFWPKDALDKRKLVPHNRDVQFVDFC